jgi:cobalamin biosynthesis Mg chelatase CobN
MRRSLPALLVTLAALVPASSAFAQSTTPGGVTVDPNSPSGTEYDIPVQKARRDAQGTKKDKKDSATRPTQTSASGDDSAPLFGQGVQPDQPETTTTTTTTPTKPKTSTPKTSKPKSSKSSTSSTTTTPVPSTETTMTSPAPSEQLPPPAEVRDAQLAAKTAAADNGPTPALAVAAGALVLLLAGLSGWWLRRRSG